MPTYTIEGEWSGYTSAQRHVVHREHTRSKTRVAQIRDLGRILFTDNTTLFLSVRDGKHGAAVNGYGRLIADCLRHGTGIVAQLPK